MKNILLLTMFICYVNNSFCQNKDLIYDVAKKSFTEEIKELEEKTKVNIKFKNFNPFLYKVDIKKKNIDNESKLLPFITNVFGFMAGNDFSTLLPKENTGALGTMGTNNKEKNRLKNINEFNKIYKQYLNVRLMIQKEHFNCTDVRKLTNDIPDKSLLNAYFKVRTSLEKVSVKEVLNLEILINNVKSYLKNNTDCLLKIGEYTISGDFTVIDISLIPREEAKSFEVPLNTIKISTKIKTKNRKKVWFSSGIMLSKNINSDYFVQSDGIDSYTIEKENRGNFMPGITTLANMEIEDKLSLSVGGGVTIEGTPHFLTGISYQLNTSNLYLNIGYGWAYRDTLSDGLSEETTYTTAPTLKTKKIMSKDFWFGLSYKL